MTVIPSAPGRPLRSFGRIQGRALSPRQARLIEELLPQVAVDLAHAGEPQRLFVPPVSRLWLEVGFGGAEHLLGQAGRNPDVGFIGCEPFLEGVAKALTGIEQAGLTNVRLLQGDARDLITAVPPASLERVFILFPDPWPKARHHKRRLVNASFLDGLARVVAPGGQVRFATDWADYGEQALAAFVGHQAFRWTAKRANDWRVPPADHVNTRYQEKRLGDIAPLFFDFERLGPSGAA